MLLRLLKVGSGVFVLIMIVVLNGQHSISAASRLGETVDIVALPQQAHFDCSNGLKYDNLQVELGTAPMINSSSTTINEPRYVQKFTPPHYPYRITATCICLIWDNPPHVDQIDSTIAIYDDDGDDGAPRTLIHTLNVTIYDISNGMHEFRSVSSDFTITEGSFYAGFTGPAGTPGLCVDTSPSTPYVVQYARPSHWIELPPDNIVKAIGIRFLGSTNGSLLDGRLNTDPAQEVAVYCNSEYVDVYAIGENSEGYLALRVNWAEIDALGIPDDEAVLIQESDDGVRLYRLNTGELQVNAPTYDAINGYDYNGYSFTWSGCEAP